jgi:glycosyltransferase involved in cell wall biosynthesis
MNDSNLEESLRILILEPYYGGSHKTFLNGLTHHLPYAFDLLTLPARKWKWRMRLGAPYFAEILHKTKRQYDRILCSTFVDVAALRGLAPSWVNEVPILTYFHENQFAYPMQVDDERDFHFALTNVTTALASDKLAFNSAYNLKTFLNGTARLLQKTPDMNFPGWEEKIRDKSIILPPGIDSQQLINTTNNDPAATMSRSPVILWNHRWEHDKNPEQFFETLFELDQQGQPFALIVLGQSFARQPAIFQEAKKKLGHRIIHFGYAPTRQQYLRYLTHGDFVISTALHEFFGLAVIEAVRAGCRPLLPCRLSYPEFFAKQYLYEDGEFQARLTGLLDTGQRLDEAEAQALTQGFTWTALAKRYHQWFAGAAI